MQEEGAAVRLLAGRRLLLEGDLGEVLLVEEEEVGDLLGSNRLLRTRFRSPLGMLRHLP